MKTVRILSEIEALEQEIHEKKKLLMELRKSVPRTEMKNYLFRDQNNHEANLFDLFGDKDELIVVQNMGKSCSFCTMWADGFNGVYHHIIEKAAFVVATPDTPAVMNAFAAERKWQFPMISTLETSFKEDLGFVKDGYLFPGVSTFIREGEQVFHVANAPFGPGDEFCSVWYFFDLLPSGRKGYLPQRKINKASDFEITNNIAINIKNLPEAVEFYTNSLGMKKSWSNDTETKLLFGGYNFYLEEGSENKVYFEFAVEDFHVAKDILVQHGCQVTHIFNDKSVIIADPFGLNFHLFERA